MTTFEENRVLNDCITFRNIVKSHNLMRVVHIIIDLYILQELFFGVESSLTFLPFSILVVWFGKIVIMIIKNKSLWNLACIGLNIATILMTKIFNINGAEETIFILMLSLVLHIIRIKDLYVENLLAKLKGYPMFKGQFVLNESDDSILYSYADIKSRLAVSFESYFAEKPKFIRIIRMISIFIFVFGIVFFSYADSAVNQINNAPVISKLTAVKPDSYISGRIEEIKMQVGVSLDDYAPDDYCVEFDGKNYHIEVPHNLKEKFGLLYNYSCEKNGIDERYEGSEYVVDSSAEKIEFVGIIKKVTDACIMPYEIPELNINEDIYVEIVDTEFYNQMKSISIYLLGIGSVVIIMFELTASIKAFRR